MGEICEEDKFSNFMEINSYFILWIIAAGSKDQLRNNIVNT
jgi:hypothetical protein